MTDIAQTIVRWRHGSRENAECPIAAAAEVDAGRGATQTLASWPALVNRADLQQLAESRLREAKVLLDAGEWSGSYHLCGYSVECALKAVVAAQVNQGDFPDKKLADAVYTHDLVKLRGLAGLGEDVAHGQLTPGQNVNWLVTKDWRETSRYETKSETEARSLYEAVSNPIDGVLPWLRTHW